MSARGGDWFARASVGRCDAGGTIDGFDVSLARDGKIERLMYGVFACAPNARKWTLVGVFLSREVANIHAQNCAGGGIWRTARVKQVSVTVDLTYGAAS